MTDEVLYKTKWLSLHRIKDDAKGVHGYDYSHEDRCDGQIIAILPYRIVGGLREYLLRKEITPCWDLDKQVVSSITGGYEGGDVKDDVIRELDEEAGYTITKEQIKTLGTCRGTKSCDTIYHLFTVDLTNQEKHNAAGDGSELEAAAKCFWAKDVLGAEDPIVYTMFVRLQHMNEQKEIPDLFTKKAI